MISLEKFYIIKKCQQMILSDDTSLYVFIELTIIRRERRTIKKTSYKFLLLIFDALDMQYMKHSDENSV